jgi:hypothetical protein
VAKGGSYYNHLSVRGKRPDFDVLVVQGCAKVDAKTMESLFSSHEGTTISGFQTPAWYLRLLLVCAQSYPGLGQENREKVRIACPSVCMSSGDVDFDLLPALAIRMQEERGATVTGLYLIPADEHRWKLSFREKTRLKELNTQLPGLRDSIKVLKYLNQTEQWGLPSFAFSSLAWHVSEQLIIYKWPRQVVGPSWDKVRVLHALLLDALQSGQIMHMFFPRDNLLSSLAKPHTLSTVWSKVSASVI